MEQHHARDEQGPGPGLPQVDLPRPTIGRPVAASPEAGAQGRASSAWRTTPSGSPFARPAIVLPERAPHVPVPRTSFARPLPMTAPRAAEAATAPQSPHATPDAHGGSPQQAPHAQVAHAVPATYDAPPQAYAPPVANQSTYAPPVTSAPMSSAPTAAAAPVGYHPAVVAEPEAFARPRIAQAPFQPTSTIATTPMQAAGRPAPVRAVAPTASGAAAVAMAAPWQADAKAPGRFAWFGPVHAGALLCIVMVAWIVSHGPSANFKAGTPAALPAAPVGADGTPAPATGGGAAGAQQTLPLKSQPKGMPSPSSAASIAISRGDTADARAIDRHLKSAPRKLDGIPSAAAAETMAPKTLPLRPSDGMTLPRAGGQRDDHAVDQHYGDTAPATPAADVELPVTTPGQAAEQAEAASHPVEVPAATNDYTPTNTGMYQTQ